MPPPEVRKRTFTRGRNGVPAEGKEERREKVGKKTNRRGEDKNDLIVSGDGRATRGLCEPERRGPFQKKKRRRARGYV